MLRKGYSQKETAEKAECSVSSVQRRLKALQLQVTGSDPTKALQASLIVKVFDLFSIMSTFLEFEHLREATLAELNKHLFRLLVDVFEMDPELGKTILSGSAYSSQVIGLVETDPSFLNERSNGLRKQFIKLLKKKYPEKLASLVK